MAERRTYAGYQSPDELASDETMPLSSRIKALENWRAQVERDARSRSLRKRQLNGFLDDCDEMLGRLRERQKKEKQK